MSFISFFPCHPHQSWTRNAKIIMHKILLILPRETLACLKSLEKVMGKFREAEKREGI